MAADRDEIEHGDLVQDVALVLGESGLESGNLVIELTESTIMHNTEANLARLVQLKSLGVRLALDDFGTGYSSLAYLHRFPIDILKIDRSFVERLARANGGADGVDAIALAKAILSLADTLGLDTVAEGIELEPQGDALLDLGCVAGQGFLFAKPGSLEALSRSAFVSRRNELWSSKRRAKTSRLPGVTPRSRTQPAPPDAQPAPAGPAPAGPPRAGYDGLRARRCVGSARRCRAPG